MAGPSDIGSGGVKGQSPKTQRMRSRKKPIALRSKTTDDIPTPSSSNNASFVPIKTQSFDDFQKQFTAMKKAQSKAQDTPSPEVEAEKPSDEKGTEKLSEDTVEKSSTGEKPLGFLGQAKKKLSALAFKVQYKKDENAKNADAPEGYKRRKLSLKGMQKRAKKIFDKVNIFGKSATEQEKKAPVKEPDAIFKPSLPDTQQEIEAQNTPISETPDEGIGLGLPDEFQSLGDMANEEAAIEKLAQNQNKFLGQKLLGNMNGADIRKEIGLDKHIKVSKKEFESYSKRFGAALTSAVFNVKMSDNAHSEINEALEDQRIMEEINSKPFDHARKYSKREMTAIRREALKYEAKEADGRDANSTFKPSMPETAEGASSRTVKEPEADTEISFKSSMETKAKPKKADDIRGGDKDNPEDTSRSKVHNAQEARAAVKDEAGKIFDAAEKIRLEAERQKALEAFIKGN